MLSNIWLFDAVLAEVSTAQLATDCWAEAGAASAKHPASKIPAQVARRRDRTFIFHAPHGPLLPPPNTPTCTPTLHPDRTTPS
jgi:hypothetical protein